MKTQNTFSDGINMDVNPIVAPKTVMSNCLNGTFTTFNGNENVLQNDMGNGKVHSAYLPSGWVPVGMAEHGGIIYVAAYNPETLESQLGSFPSPQQNFESSKNGLGETFTKLEANKYKLFVGENKDIELKPGNKLAITLAYEDYLIPYAIIEPNYNNALDKHKRHWSILLCLLTSNGVLTDITDKLENTVYDYAFDGNEEYKNYFFLLEQVADLNPYLRIYSGNLTGSPYIQVIENLASSMDTFVTTGYRDGIVRFIVTCNIESTSLLYGYPFKPIGEPEEGLLGFYYTYIKSNGDKVSGWKLLNNTPKLITTCKNLEELNSKIELLINCGISENNLEIKNLSIYLNRNYTLTEESALKYTLNITDTIEIEDVDKNDTITLIINPCFSWEDVVQPQTSFEFRLVFEVSKIGTGIHDINQWRYYYDNDFITLTWGMESYPAEGEDIKTLYMEFLDWQGIPIDFNSGQTLLEFKYFSYNGEFTEVFNSELFTYKFPYIVKIHWIVGGETLYAYRWILPTTLYNDYYLAKLVLDFYKDWDNSEISTLNNINNLILQFNSSPQEKVELSEWSLFPAITFNSELYNNDLKNAVNNVIIDLRNNADFPTYENLLKLIEAQNIPVKENNAKFGWEDFTYKTCTYTYTPSLDISTSEVSNKYPFDIAVGSCVLDSITNVEGSNSYKIENNSIINTLIKYHNLHYEYKDNIHVANMFEGYPISNLIFTADSYVAIVTSKVNHAGSDEGAIFFLSFNTATGAYAEKPYEAYYKKGNRNVGEMLVTLWSLFETLLNKLANTYTRSLYAIPVVFYCKLYGSTIDNLNQSRNCRIGINYAIRTGSGWALYWNTPYWYEGIVNDYTEYEEMNVMPYFNLNTIFKSLPKTVYEVNNYIRSSKTNGEDVNGFIVQNGNTPISLEKELEFKFTVNAKANVNITFNNLPYNSTVEKNCISQVPSEYKEAFRKQLKFYLNGEAKDNIVETVSKDYSYINVLPGNAELSLLIADYQIHGIPTVVKYMNPKNMSYKCIVPALELYGDLVYKYILDNNGEIIEYLEIQTAGVVTYKYTRHITSDEIKPHALLVIATDSTEITYLDLTDTDTIAGDNIFII